MLTCILCMYIFTRCVTQIKLNMIISGNYTETVRLLRKIFAIHIVFISAHQQYKYHCSIIQTTLIMAVESFSIS